MRTSDQQLAQVRLLRIRDLDSKLEDAIKLIEIYKKDILKLTTQLKNLEEELKEVTSKPKSKSITRPTKRLTIKEDN